MPKKLVQDLNVRIQAEIARHREGVNIDGLHDTLAVDATGWDTMMGDNNLNPRCAT